MRALRLTSAGVMFRINPRQDSRNVAIKIDVWDAAGSRRIDFFNAAHEPHSKPPVSTWIYRKKLSDGRYLVELRLENCLAYRRHFDIGDSLFQTCPPSWTVANSPSIRKLPRRRHRAITHAIYSL